jgi:hypothetical protein
VGFLVTNLTWRAKKVIRFYNRRYRSCLEFVQELERVVAH